MLCMAATAASVCVDVSSAVKGVGSYASKLNKKLTASITNKIENVRGHAYLFCCCAAHTTLAPAQETVALTTKMGTKLDIIKSKE